MPRHFNLRAILEYYQFDKIPDGLDNDQRKNFRKSANKFRFERGKLYRPSKRGNPIPGGEKVLVVIEEEQQEEITRKEHL